MAATIKIVLFNEAMQRSYEVDYFMNFSEINNNREMMWRLWSHLALQATFTFINIDNEVEMGEPL